MASLMNYTGIVYSMIPIVSNSTYCTAIGGVQGCCKIGHICSQIANQCTVVGQVRCPNDNFCCGKHALKSPLSFPSTLTGDSNKF